MIILGIDPGTHITGYGVIESVRHQSHVIDSGCLAPPRGQSMEARLAFIFEKLEPLITAHQPDALALEEAFFAKNAASALKLGQCRGIVLLAAARATLPVYEYSPRTIKQAVTGSGRATKEQVQKMVQSILRLAESPPTDAADALAAALCHSQSHRLQGLASAIEQAAASGGS